MAKKHGVPQIAVKQLKDQFQFPFFSSKYFHTKSQTK
jgi:hypothetical protein